MFVKIHEQIFDSSIMEEGLETRYIWFCLLTLADKDGFVDMTASAIARRINVDDNAIVSAINKFMQPDVSSRTQVQEGRRLEKIRESFGWKIVNYIYYRNLRSDEDRREYMRNYMRNKRDVSKKVNCKLSKHLLAQAEAEAEAEAEADLKTNIVQETKIPCSKTFETIWKQYPNRVGKKAALKHFRRSVKTDKDIADIQKALTNYLTSKTVLNGFVQNGSTWFNNWRDWIDYICGVQKETIEQQALRLRKEMGEIL